MVKVKVYGYGAWEGKNESFVVELSRLPAVGETISFGELIPNGRLVEVYQVCHWVGDSEAVGSVCVKRWWGSGL